MSEIAGRMSVHEGAKYLEKKVRRPRRAAVRRARRGAGQRRHSGRRQRWDKRLQDCGWCMGANVTILDVNARRLAYLDDIFRNEITTLYSTRDNIQKAIAQADLVIGAVLLPGRTNTQLVRKADLARMKPGAVLVDVAIDQGGCIETSHATTHDDPVYLVDGIVHYCVANMPGAVSRTSTLALGNATLPYVGLSWQRTAWKLPAGPDHGLMAGLNCYDGTCTFPGVAEALNLNMYRLRRSCKTASFLLNFSECVFGSETA